MESSQHLTHFPSRHWQCIHFIRGSQRLEQFPGQSMNTRTKGIQITGWRDEQSMALFCLGLHCHKPAHSTTESLPFSNYHISTLSWHILILGIDSTTFLTWSWRIRIRGGILCKQGSRFRFNPAGAWRWIERTHNILSIAQYPLTRDRRV